jgi:NAD(P)-dependent dehydrogenase (short-subunit alcohol dehydrogenase family)
MSDVRRVALVTGCDSGIGKALAGALIDRGLTVYATGLGPEAMADLVGRGAQVRRLDVTRPEEIEALKGGLAAEGVRVDLLVNNAGYGAMGPVAEMPMDDVRRQYEVNVFGLLAVTQAFVGPMIAARRGLIVNVGSTSGILTSPFAGVYCSTKAAVHALNDGLRMELAPFGVRVMRVEPNQIRTRFGDTAAAGLGARFAPSSHYLAVKDAAIARAQGSQVGNAMPAEDFARRVAEAALRADPPIRLRLGRELWPYTVFKPFLPSRTVDRLLSRRFKLDRLA